jgi:hypothetical protein
LLKLFSGEERTLTAKSKGSGSNGTPKRDELRSFFDCVKEALALKCTSGLKD